MEYFGCPDAMDMILDQVKNNPRMEISNIKTVKFPLTACFERIDAKKMEWNGQKLSDKDIVYVMDQDCIILKVRIYEGRPDPEENFKLTVQQNLENAEATMKAKREAGIEVCSGPNCGSIFNSKGYNSGAF